MVLGDGGDVLVDAGRDLEKSSGQRNCRFRGPFFLRDSFIPFKE